MELFLPTSECESCKKKSVQSLCRLHINTKNNDGKLYFNFCSNDTLCINVISCYRNITSSIKNIGAIID